MQSRVTRVVVLLIGLALTGSACGKYSINNNHCICENSYVNQTVAITGCKCSFPESGHFTGR